MRTLPLAFSVFCMMAMMPLALFAQEIRIVEGATTVIDDPSVYRAYYGKLTGEPHVFSFTTDAGSTNVRATILMPDTVGEKTDVSAILADTAQPGEPLALSNGDIIEWQRFYDTAGRESYLAGPVLEASGPPGTYEIRVWSSNNDSPYVLVIQGAGGFSFAEIISRFTGGPWIKSEFFGRPAVSAFATPLLLWPILGILGIVGVVLAAVMFWRRRVRPL